jgi:Predicted permease.
MNNFFFWRLALTHIGKNRKTYFPYMLAASATVAMYYIIHFLSRNPGLTTMSGGDALQKMLGLGTRIVGIFSAIFLFYTNSFLIRQRKKEFGLFNILGMEKKHIASVLWRETVLTLFISLFAGLVSGIVISKFMFLLLLKILHFRVPLERIVSLPSIKSSIFLFTGIFVIAYINNLRHIRLAKPIELLKGGQVGEKEPRIKWLLVIVGLCSLGSGYYIALTTETPLDALNQFFLAVLLVIVGTYALFTAGTIALLKGLRKNKSFYYQTNHFISLSGMIYRMKRNAVGLANICILSTMVLVTLSSTVSLYVGMENLLRNRYPKDVEINMNHLPKESAPEIIGRVQSLAKERNIEITDPVHYRYGSLFLVRDGNRFSSFEGQMNEYGKSALIGIIPLEEYQAMGGNPASLADDEVLLYTFRGKEPSGSIKILDRTFRIKERLENLPIKGLASALATDTYFLVVKEDNVILDLYARLKATGYKGDLSISYYYGFNTKGDAESEIALVKDIQKALAGASLSGSAEGLEESRESFYSVYGGLFFLGIFLGTLFILATVLIMYYKQISEGYEDKKRFEIMQKVGLSKEEIKKSVKSQILQVFFLPLAASVIHIAFAFKVITRLLVLFNLTDVRLLAFCTAGTILVFGLFYAAVYLMTAKTYYRIVSQA